jgi:hypothetical protein
LSRPALTRSHYQLVQKRSAIGATSSKRDHFRLDWS